MFLYSLSLTVCCVKSPFPLVVKGQGSCLFSSLVLLSLKFLKQCLAPSRTSEKHDEIEHLWWNPSRFRELKVKLGSSGLKHQHHILCKSHLFPFPPALTHFGLKGLGVGEGRAYSCHLLFPPTHWGKAEECALALGHPYSCPCLILHLFSCFRLRRKDRYLSHPCHDCSPLSVGVALLPLAYGGYL